MATKRNLFEGMSPKEIELAKLEAREKAEARKRAKGIVKEERTDRELIHKTKVKINLKTLRTVVKELEEALDKVGWERSNAAQRSAFHSWNTVSKFAKEHDNGQDYIVMDIEGCTAGGSKRIYYNPSITSLCKAFRKCIEPLNEGNKFVFFDISAAEFFLNCWYAGEAEAVNTYLEGKDIYMYYSYLFPEGTSRDIIKQSLVGNLYGLSSYRLSLNCGISENNADRILCNLANRIPKVTLLKNRIINSARRSGFYMCPNGFEKEMINVLSVKEYKDGTFNPLFALSAYTQSGLSMWMHGVLKDLESRTAGTLLSVFDSVLLEVHEDNVERAKSWIVKRIYPFHAGTIAVGDNFYEAYKG